MRPACLCARTCVAVYGCMVHSAPGVTGRASAGSGPTLHVDRVQAVRGAVCLSPLFCSLVGLYVVCTSLLLPPFGLYLLSFCPLALFCSFVGLYVLSVHPLLSLSLHPCFNICCLSSHAIFSVYSAYFANHFCPCAASLSKNKKITGTQE